MSNGMNIVAHNLQAMFSDRQLGIVTDRKGKSTEKLSSGYRINRAADDAAGLAISEKMRRQIKGLTQGTRNAQDGISMCQIADGALNEVSDMMHRLTELSVQSANGTNDAQDRQAIQQEVNALVREIDRVADTTTFNEQKIFENSITSNDYDFSGELTYDKAYEQLVNGTFPNFTVSIDIDGKSMTADEANAFVKSCSNIAILDFLNSLYDVDIPQQLIQYQEALGNKIGQIVDNSKVYYSYHSDSEFNEKMYEAGEALRLQHFSFNRSEWDYDESYLGGWQNFKAANAMYMQMENFDLSLPGNTNTVAVDAYEALHSLCGQFRQDESYDGTSRSQYNIGAKMAFGAATYNIMYYSGVLDTGLGDTFEYGKQLHQFDFNKNPDGSYCSWLVLYNNEETQGYMKLIDYVKKQYGEFGNNNGVWIQSGAEAGDGIWLKFGSMNTGVLGINGINVSTQFGAEDAISRIKSGLGVLSGIRSYIGAQQNRLEHTIRHQENTIENTQQAESLIRDTDMASEMMNYSAANVIQEAGQAMLSQANHSNQGVLSLLQ